MLLEMWALDQGLVASARALALPSAGVGGCLFISPSLHFVP